MKKPAVQGQTSTDEILHQHLLTLATKTSWRVNQLPASITEAVLRALDGRGWIEVRYWTRRYPCYDPGPKGDPVVRPSANWYSPNRHPHGMGDWSAILAMHPNDPELAPEIALRENGKAQVAELGIAPRPPGDKPQSGTKKRGRKQKLDKTAQAVSSMIDNGDMKQYGNNWKELCVRYGSELPNGYRSNALRARVKRELERREREVAHAQKPVK